MPKGTVKWFNLAKGYGFIQPQGSGKDVFVHISAVERAGFSTLNRCSVCLGRSLLGPQLRNRTSRLRQSRYRRSR
jgi:cold shock CspA family protein